MADRIIRTEEVEERPRDDVVVERDSTRSGAGWILAVIVIIVLLLLFLWANPFSTNDTDNNGVDVNVPAPTVNIPEQTDDQPDAPQAPATEPEPGATNETDTDPTPVQ